MDHPRVSALLVVALLLSPLSIAGAAAPSTPRQALHLHIGSFDPVVDGAPAGFSVGRLPVAGPYIVQFPYPLHGGEARAVADAGGTVVAYLPDGAFVVAAGRSFPAAARGIEGVRWVGALPPWAKMAPGAETADLVHASFSGSVVAFALAVRQAGLNAAVLGGGSAILGGAHGVGAAAAGLDSVVWVEPYRPPVSLNYQADLTDRLRSPANGSSYSESSGALWMYDPSAQQFLGYGAADFRVDVTDQGVDGSHPAFNGRMLAYRSWTGASNWTDTSGHGTHVAATAVGSGALLPADSSLPSGYFAGAAPGAGLIAQAYNGSALDYNGMADFASANGAIVSVNSWGDGAAATRSNYTAASAVYDALTADARGAGGLQPLLFVFAAGNENQAANSILPPGTAKNVLTVGATGNDYAGGTASTDIASFASFGPADDLRIKPDIVAPGERVASANATQDPGSGVLPRPALGGASYIYLSGTSQAAPQVAGASAVAAQFLRDTKGIDATPALLKAALINGATPLPGYAWPGPAQGWGRLDARAALLDYPGHVVEFVREGRYTFTSSVDVYQHNVEVDAGSELRITLVWTDAAGSPLASRALVNDLDLEVRDPSDSVIFAGNAINQTTAYSVAGPGAGDHVNNVEAVRIQSAQAGVWKVVVRPYNLPTGAQSFALVVSGALNATAHAMSVTPEAASIEAPPGGTVPINVTILNLGDVTENVTVSVEPRWVGGEQWVAPNATATFGALEQRVVRLNLTNNDTGAAGSRGQLMIRVTVDSTGYSFTAEVAVRLAAAPCLRAAVDNVTGQAGIMLVGAQPAPFTVELENCGNTQLHVSLTVDGPDAYGPLVLSPPAFHTMPGQAVSVAATLQAPPGMPDLDEVVFLYANSSTDSTGLVVSIHRRTGVQLNATGVPASIELRGTEAVFTLSLANEGAEGVVLAPQVLSANGWEATASPAVQTVGAGQTVTFEIHARRPTDGDAQDTLVVVLYPGLSGSPTASLAAAWSSGNRPPTLPWPSDAAAGFAILAGLAAAAGAAVLAARLRRQQG